MGGRGGRDSHPRHQEPAADRVVPRVGVLVKPGTGRLAFYRHFRTKSDDTVSPYDLRRTYAQWLDLARIPQFRQDYYMAHRPRDLNALYKGMREVAGYPRRTPRRWGSWWVTWWRSGW